MVVDQTYLKHSVGSVLYHCEECTTDFCSMNNRIVCPQCGSTNWNQMVAIYVEDDPEVYQMTTKVEFNAG